MPDGETTVLVPFKVVRVFANLLFQLLPDDSLVVARQYLLSVYSSARTTVRKET